MTSLITTNALPAVQNLDLSEIIDLLSLKEKWSRSTCLKVQGQYRTFLFLNVMGYGVPPLTKQIDEFWETHILFTEKYETDSQILGVKVHHRPLLEPENLSLSEKERLMNLFNLSVSLFEAEPLQSEELHFGCQTCNACSCF